LISLIILLGIHLTLRSMNNWLTSLNVMAWLLVCVCWCVDSIHLGIINICLNIHLHGLLSLDSWLIISIINLNCSSMVTLILCIDGGLLLVLRLLNSIIGLIAFLDVVIKKYSIGVLETYRSVSILSLSLTITIS
jgi:hypothetical protein